MRFLDGSHDDLPDLHGLLDAMHLMRGAAAAHQLHATSAKDALPQGLVEVHRLDAGQGNLRHLDVEDAILLHEAGVGDGKLSASADNAPYYPDEESQHQQGYSCIEKSGFLLGIPIVSQPDAEDAAQHTQQAEEQIAEDGRPVQPSVEDDFLAFFKALFDIICHNDKVFPLQSYTLFLNYNNEKARNSPSDPHLSS